MFATLFPEIASKIIAILATLVVIAGLVVAVQYYRNAYDTASTKLSQALTDNANITAQAKQQITALQTENAQALARQTQTTNIRSKINAAPTSNACANSPAIRALLDGLHTTTTTNTKPLNSK